MARIFSNILILISVILLPPYLSACIVILFIFVFKNFLESIFWGFCIDMIYGGGALRSYFPYVLTVSLSLIFLLSFKVKKMLRFYSE
ncbi:MAG: hypothetical protein WCX27_01070 [Candidatus Paceibacterota bacterium]|jgi:hypothetical protein